MQGVMKTHQLARVILRCSSPSLLLCSLSRLQSSCILPPNEFRSSNSSLRRDYFTSGTIYGDYMQSKCNLQRNVCQCQKCSMMLRASYSTEAGTIESSVTGIVSQDAQAVVDQRSAPPNAWLWSLVQSCPNREDANLLFDMLKRLRIFRLSNLRIHENFNCSLCQEITKTCVRVGVIDLGDVDTLWKIEKIRSETMKEHSLGSGLPCAKAFLIDHKPEDAAAVIQLLNQESATLQHDLPTMLSALSNMGLKLNVNVEDLTREGVFA
ncbi:hypothetical protein CQW23_17293 [Capsicum baccatum]|uniref:Uncharacterized protein n=1 Tax=Capsicum baccatum TaxID=33114 RepID=A0A2G2WDF6_CAPBA|nr:hypothetical protein CQW23_17293 [Capsicum baccatum]